MQTAPTFTLNSGRQMPQVGLGTYPMDDSQAEHVVSAALDMGYRLIDTAVNYGNEKGVGQGIVDSGIERDEVFVTTKLPGRSHGYQPAMQSLDESCDRMGLDYVDLLLIHWPCPSKGLYVDTWKAMIEMQRSGRVRAIGVSNFKDHHIDQLIEQTGVTPAVNQVQMQPFLARESVRAYAQRHGIVLQSWSPLGKGASSLFGRSEDPTDDETIYAIARTHGKSAAQIVLRWHVQLGATPVPKSANAERLQANIDIFDFQLGDDEMQAISNLDLGESYAADSDQHEEN